MSTTARLATRRIKTLDNWTPLDYKESFNDVRTPLSVPGWVGPENQRRLRSYAMLESYYSNASRWWLEESLDIDIQDKSHQDRREYGDPFVLVETAMSSCIGESQRVVVEGSLADDAGAKDQQKVMDQWAEDEKFYMKVIESERQSAKLGDSVYVLGWDEKKKRPRLHVYDPGFYFPVFNELDGSSAEDFPRKVHIAYEFEKLNPQTGEEEIYVRKITWELIGNSPAYTPAYAGEATTVNCVYSDVVYNLGDVGKDLNTFSGPVYQTITEPVMLGIDYIPVVHVPNGVNLQGHFGRSVLFPVLQILDDIQSTDTDLQASSATTGSPPIVVTGKTGGKEVTTYGPGSVFYVGDGDATMIDTSTSLDALIKLKEALLSRLSVNGRTPESLLGRVKPNEVPSGIALTLSFTPHSRMVEEMRLVRKQKYSLLLKFVGRYLGFKDERVMTLEFGSYLPAEKQEAMTMVTNLLGAKAISLETAVQMLMKAGVPIENWIEEIKRIHGGDVDTAIQLMGITGDPNTALEFLGLPKLSEEDLLALNDQNANDPAAQGGGQGNPPAQQ